MIKILEEYEMLQMLIERSLSITLVQRQLPIQRVKNIDDEKSKYSKSSYSTNTSKAASITKRCNYQIKIKKVFTTFNTIIEEMENEDSDLTDSYDDNK